MSNHQNNMKQTAKRLAQQGRNGDSVLVHMSPGELAGLKALAYEHGTELTVNPVTGLPEAFKLKKLFKKLLGPAIGVLSNFILPGNPWGAAALTAALTKARGKSWKEALLSGAGAGLSSAASLKLAGAGKLATDAATKATTTAATSAATNAAESEVYKGMIDEATKKALSSATGATLKSAGLEAAKQGAFGSNLLKGVTTTLGSEAGRAAGLTALGGKLGATGLLMSTLAAGEPSGKLKPMAMPKSKYWVGKGKPLWNQGEWNPETGEFEGQGYGEGEFTEDVNRAAIGFADGGNVNTELSDVLSPADAANLTGLAAINYGNPANATATQTYAPPATATNTTTTSPYTNYAAQLQAAAAAANQYSYPTRYEAMQQAAANTYNSRASDIPLMATTNAAVDPGMAAAPSSLEDYYKKYLMTSSGGQTPARSLAPLTSYMAEVEGNLRPSTFGQGQTLASKLGTSGRQDFTQGWQYIRGPDGQLIYSPVGATQLQGSTATDPLTAALVAFMGRNPVGPGAGTGTGTETGTGAVPGTGTGTGAVPGTVDPNAIPKVVGGVRVPTQAILNSQFWKSMSPTQQKQWISATNPAAQKAFSQTLSTKQKALRNQYMRTIKNAEGGAIKGYAAGGTTYAAAGKLLRGPGDGMSDSIPAVIRGNPPQKAALGDGEFVVPADVVANLGNGSTRAGAKQLYAMMDRVRVAKNGRKQQPRAINSKKYLPA